MQQRIKQLIDELNKASEDYYNGSESMSNAQWDAKFDELKRLEEESGIVLPSSPTQAVGRAPKVGTKVTHEFTARSLDKTKDIAQMTAKMAGQSAVLLMWKLDGGTLQLTYDGGSLIIAATRGNGTVGQDITKNALYIKGIPASISYKGRLVLRGEAVMSYSDFDAINETLPEGGRYANPRNLANATVSMLDPKEVKKRTIYFKPFGIVHMSQDAPEGFEARMQFLKSQGFEPVDFELLKPLELESAIERWTDRVADYDFPVDGLVVATNEIAAAEQLPGTAHHPDPLAGFAFKWADTEAETILREIEWSASRTGLLNPVAIFDTVDLEGTSVSRASLHNFSYVREKHLRIGDRISVYKANMIIPQIRENLSENESEFSEKEVEDMIPICPVCKEKAVISETNGIETMRCKNPLCTAKSIGRFVHFAARDGMDIEGMSEATITKFVEKGFLHRLCDMYRLDEYEDEIKQMEGFGEKSYQNLWDAIERSQKRDVISFVNALGIPNVGKGQAKLLAEHFDGSAKRLLEVLFGNGAEDYDYTVIDGFGSVISDSINRFTREVTSTGSFAGELLGVLSIEDVKIIKNTDSPVSGKTFVITGSLNGFANRDELKALIESLGGKVTGSVTAKTDYLINNDVESTSGKNKKAKELNIPIISEEDFMNIRKSPR